MIIFIYMKANRLILRLTFEEMQTSMRIWINSYLPVYCSRNHDCTCEALNLPDNAPSSFLSWWRPHLPSLGHLWRSTGRICPSTPTSASWQKRGSARQLFLPQLYLSTPAIASILTGRLQSTRNRLYTLADSLDTSIPTLPPPAKPTDTTPDSSANGISSRNRKGSTTTPSSTIKANTVTRLS